MSWTIIMVSEIRVKCVMGGSNRCLTSNIEPGDGISIKFDEPKTLRAAKEAAGEHFADIGWWFYLDSGAICPPCKSEEFA